MDFQSIVVGETKILNLPIATDIDKNVLITLQENFYEMLPKITLNSEMAKRGFMIAPVLWEIIRHAKAKIKLKLIID